MEREKRNHATRDEKKADSVKEEAIRKVVPLSRMADGQWRTEVWTTSIVCVEI